MISEREMRAYLEANGAKARNTADREYWHHRSWSFGLPLELAFVHLEANNRQQERRRAEILVLKCEGWRHRKAGEGEGAGWIHPQYPGRYSRGKALQMAMDSRKETEKV